MYIWWAGCITNLNTFQMAFCCLAQIQHRICMRHWIHSGNIAPCFMLLYAWFCDKNGNLALNHRFLLHIKLLALHMLCNYVFSFLSFRTNSLNSFYSFFLLPFLFLILYGSMSLGWQGVCQVKVSHSNLLETKSFDGIRKPVQRLSKNFGVLLRASMFWNLQQPSINLSYCFQLCLKSRTTFDTIILQSSGV